MDSYVKETNQLLNSKVFMLREDINGSNTFISLLGCDFGYRKKFKQGRLHWG
jgi:hypothetical protein